MNAKLVKNLCLSRIKQKNNKQYYNFVQSNIGLIQKYFFLKVVFYLKLCTLQVIYLLSIYFISMQTGTVKFFNETKGFGFVVDDESGQEIFLHVSGLNGTKVRENDRIEFETVEGRKGLNAISVKRT
jgi:CspA family cold shock protein